MFAKSIAVVALLFAASASALRMDTPAEIKECQDLDITYGEGAPKYLVAVVPGEDPCADAIKEFAESSDTKQTWKVNVPAGTKVMFVVEDSTSAEAWSAPITVKDGDKSCLPKVESAPSVTPEAPKPAPTTSAPTASKPATPSNPPKVVSPGGVANVEAGAPDSAASSSFVISSAAVAGVIGAAALLL